MAIRHILPVKPKRGPLMYLAPTLLTIALVTPIGIALMGDEKIELPQLPLYISLGMGVYGITLMIIGYHNASCLVPLTLTGISLIFLYNKKPVLTMNGVYALALFIISIHHFTTAADTLKWPPIGDAISHGTYTALIQHLGKIPLTYKPYAPDIVAFYPLGFHTLTASLLPLMNLELGEGMLVISTTAISLIPPLMYTATWLLTKSKLPATIAYLSIWDTYTPWRPFITGMYYLGVYPFIVGLALSLTYLCLLIRESMETPSKDAFLLSGAVICGSLLFIYPSFFLFTVTIHVAYYLSNQGTWRRPKAIAAIGLGIGVIISRLPFLALINQVDKYIDTSTRPEFIYGTRVLIRDPLVSSVSGWVVLTATLPAVYFMSNKRNKYVSALYLLLFTTVFASYNRSLFKGWLWFTLPNRSWFLLINLSWIILLTEIHAVNQRIPNHEDRIYLKFKGISKTTISKASAATLALSLIGYGIPFVALAPALNDQFNGNIYPKNRKDSWYVSDVAVWNMLEWVDENIPPRDLIMTDLSWSALWLTSYGVQNTTNAYLTIMNHRNRALQVNYAWKYPEDAGYLRHIIQQYNISYIMVTSDYKYFDWHWLNGTQNIAMEKPVTPQKCIQAFDEHPFLTRVYKENYNVVYKVEKEPT